MRKEVYVCRIQEGYIWNTLEASLLFWAKLSKSLEEMGYQINEYYWCFVKNIIDNKKFPILWHVDDLNTSHFNPAVFPEFFLTLMQNMGRLHK